MLVAMTVEKLEELMVEKTDNELVDSMADSTVV
jgi:hypothetical protein